MLVEVGSPASLPLGLVKYQDEGRNRVCLLDLTVQHPPMQMFAQADSKPLKSGARADLVNKHARKFLQYHQLKPQARVDIEPSILAMVGLGSDPFG